MSNRSTNGGNFAILLSLILAMLVSAMPLPDLIASFKPDWVALVLIYWVMALPNRIGVYCGWILGLFVDVLEGNLLGINAMSLALVAFLIQMIYHRLRLFPRWKQSLNVTVVIGLHQMLVLALSSLVRPANTDFSYWLPLLGNLLFWPWVFIVLRDVRRRYC